MQLRYVFTELGQRPAPQPLDAHRGDPDPVRLADPGRARRPAQPGGRTRSPTAGAASSRSPSTCAARQDDNPACTGEVTDAQKAAIQKVVDANPEVASSHTESKEEAFEKLKEQFPGQVRRARTRRSPPPTCRSRSGSRSRTPTSTATSRAPWSASTASRGIQDVHKVLKPIFSTISRLKWGSLGTALVPGARGPAAGRQHDPAGGVRPTARDRHHAAGRRLDALHRAAVPARGAGDRRDRRGARRRWRSGPSCSSASGPALSDRPELHPVGRHCTTTGSPLIVIAILGPMLTLLPTLVLTRKYLKV